MLCPVLGSPVKKTHGYNAVCPVKEIEDKKGTGSCAVQGETERAAIVSLVVKNPVRI